MATVSVEGVAKDRTSKTLIVGAVHTQLMRPAHKRIQRHEGTAVGQKALYAVIGYGCLAVVEVDTLTWPVHDVGNEGQRYSALPAVMRYAEPLRTWSATQHRRLAVEHSLVALLNLP